MNDKSSASPATLGGTPSREEVAHDIGYRVLWAANFGSFTDLRKVAREAADFLHSKPESAPLEDCEPYMREPYKSALSATSATRHTGIPEADAENMLLNIMNFLTGAHNIDKPSSPEERIALALAAIRNVIDADGVAFRDKWAGGDFNRGQS